MFNIICDDKGMIEENLLALQMGNLVSDPVLLKVSLIPLKSSAFW